MSHEIRIPMNGDCRPIVRILTALFLIKTDYVTMTTMKRRFLMPVLSLEKIGKERGLRFTQVQFNGVVQCPWRPHMSQSPPEIASSSRKSHWR
ncbi:MAG: hypothetical protein WB586_16615 [Chthoniobacterales bacterium]